MTHGKLDQKPETRDQRHRRRLIVTNGESGVGAIRNAGIEGELLSWEDVLHDGPVPACSSLEELSGVRAAYLAACGWGEVDAIRKKFGDRDAMLRRAGDFEEVVLFFEHDLYDQLQVIQVLNELDAACPISMVWPATYIGYSTPEALRTAFQARTEVEDRSIRQARQAWKAFTRTHPADLVGIASQKEAALRHLPAAFERLIQEYPECRDGLSRTERQVLRALSERPMGPGALFRAYQETEEAMFMGDASFWICLEALGNGNALLASDRATPPSSSNLQEFLESTLCITDLGTRVLAGEKHRFSCQAVDRWIGGVYINATARWCWDGVRGRFRRHDNE